MKKPVVSIVMGSDSDMDIMRETAGILARFGVPHELRIVSAHRSPRLLARYVRRSERAGVRIFIAGAGAAAALPGAVAALTTRPVLGVPIPSSHLQGLDSLLAIAQMPAGAPVAALAIGAGGARNAAILAVQIMALGDGKLARSLTDYKKKMERDIEAKDLKARRGPEKKRPRRQA